MVIMEDGGNFALFVREYDDSWNQLTNWITHSRAIFLRDSKTFFADKEKTIFKMIENTNC